MYKSKFGQSIEEMLIVRHNSGLQMKHIYFLLDDFDTYCACHYPDAELLTKAIAEEWIHISGSTSRCHVAKRVVTMKHLGKYQRSIGLDAYVPDYGITIPKAEEPHLFTDGQLASFFEAADTRLKPTNNSPHRDILFPVFFRLVYCCGLRCSEACNLKLEDVDLQRGTVSIYQSKGQKDREIFMSDDIRDLCFRFDRFYRKIIPGRSYFFQPAPNRERLLRYEADKVFNIVLKQSNLDKVPGKKFTLHGLRHLFAVQNIRKCADEGEDFYNWMHYLSRYMGHKHIRYTLYYLHITSQLFPVYKDKLDALEKGIGVVYAED